MTRLAARHLPYGARLRRNFIATLPDDAFVSPSDRGFYSETALVERAQRRRTRMSHMKRLNAATVRHFDGRRQVQLTFGNWPESASLWLDPTTLVEVTDGSTPSTYGRRSGYGTWMMEY